MSAREVGAGLGLLSPSIALAGLSIGVTPGLGGTGLGFALAMFCAGLSIGLSTILVLWERSTKR